MNTKQSIEFETQARGKKYRSIYKVEDEDDKRNLFEFYSNIQSNVQSVAPKDRFNIVHVTFLLFGISTLLPWNVFITAEQVSFVFFGVYCVFFVYIFVIAFLVFCRVQAKCQWKPGRNVSKKLYIYCRVNWSDYKCDHYSF
jgi:hypothetical protein